MTVFENKIDKRVYIFDKRKMRTFAGVTEIVACVVATLVRRNARADI